MNRSSPRKPQNLRYFLLNKPYGVLCQFTDTAGRPTLADFFSIPEMYAAGRLDTDSEGLLFLTNDGNLIHLLAEPRYKFPKTYLVQVERIPTDDALDELRAGVILDGTRTGEAIVTRLEAPPELWERSVPIRYRKSVPTAWLRVVITEGRNRQVRRMTAAVGHPTLRLVRVAIGPFNLDLQPGQWRELAPEKVQAQVAANLGKR